MRAVISSTVPSSEALLSVNTQVESQHSPLQKRSNGVVENACVVGSLSLVNAALGAGVLAYPYAFMSTGLVAGTGLTFMIGTLSFVSLCILMRCMKTVRDRDPTVASYGDVVRVTLGSGASAGLEALKLCSTECDGNPTGKGHDTKAAQHVSHG